MVTPTRGDVEIGPVVLVRCAAFARERIDGFGDATLAERARSAGAGHDHHAAYETLYEQVLAAERAHLHAVTVSDPSFLRALAVANPALAVRAATYTPTVARKKRVRHMETSLYRTLARAVGRPTPCGLWSGVAYAQTTSDACAQLVTATVVFAPDLAPFAAIVETLARRQAHRASGPWRLARGARRGANDDTWTFPVHGGVVRRVRIEGVALAPFASECTELRPWRDVLAAATRAFGDAADHVVNVLVDAEFLVGGLTFPRRFETPWEALKKVELALDDDEGARAAWRTASTLLRATADELGERFPEMDASEVLRAMGRADDAVQALATTLGVSLVSRPRASLRADLSMQVGLPRDDERLRRIAGCAAAAIGHYGVASLESAAWTAHAKRRLSPPGGSARSTPSTWEDVVAALGGDPVLASRVGEMSSLLDCVDDEVACSEGTSAPALNAISPIGALTLTPWGDRYLIAGYVPDPALAIARHSLLDDRGGQQLASWTRAHLTRLEVSFGVRFAELVAPFASNPNVLARRFPETPILDLLGLDVDGIDARQHSLAHLLSWGAPVLLVAGRDERWVVRFGSVADVGQGDTATHDVLLTSFRAASGLIARNTPFDFQRGRTTSTPRVRIASGDIVRARRIMVAGVELNDLLCLPPRERFAAWAALVARERLADLLYVTFPGEEPCLVRRDSPLAVASIFEGARGGVPFLLLEEIHEGAFLRTDRGHFRADFVVPYATGCDASANASQSLEAAS